MGSGRGAWQSVYLKVGRAVTTQSLQGRKSPRQERAGLREGAHGLGKGPSPFNLTLALVSPRTSRRKKARPLSSGIKAQPAQTTTPVKQGG